MLPAVLRQRRLTMTNMWNLKDWIEHSRRARFIHYAKSFPSSRLLRRVAPQFTVFLLWTVFAVFLSPRGVIHKVVVPLTPLSLVSTFVAALLTMRSNTGLSRLTEGRETWGRVIFRTRDLGQLIATKVYPKDQQLAFLMGK
jgi:predicted membrane chloride channel (bestrophin family)